MEKIALLRGVTPVGKNKISRVSYLIKILMATGLSLVQMYIQSGNVIFYNTIKNKIGTNLAVIIKH